MVVLKMRVFFGPNSLVQTTTELTSVALAFGSAVSPFLTLGLTICLPLARALPVRIWTLL